MARIDFYGERLLQARELRGLTAQQVGDYLGISKQAVSKYERARSKPSNESFQKLVELLKVPPHYFSKPPLQPNRSPIFYRSMASATISMRNVAEQKFECLREITDYLSQFLEFPVVNMRPCVMPSDPTRITKEDIENEASELRKFWGLGDGVISNVVHLLENKGMIVARLPLNSDKLDAFSTMDDYLDRPFVVLASDKESPFRSRFDAAHELGHLVLHRNMPRQLLKDRVVFKVIEDQAHLFASAFLLPARTFGMERLQCNLDSFKDIKIKWRASIGSMISRACELGMISESQKTTLWIDRSRAKWSKVEPFDDQYEAEMPHLIPESFKVLAGDGGVEKEKILFDLALPSFDVEEVAGIPDFFAGPSMADIDEPIPTLKFPIDAF